MFSLTFSNAVVPSIAKHGQRNSGQGSLLLGYRNSMKSKMPASLASRFLLLRRLDGDLLEIVI
jgi:hypothetical protein